MQLDVACEQRTVGHYCWTAGSYVHVCEPYVQCLQIHRQDWSHQSDLAYVIQD